tara:strand:- start:2171 stop:2278 length:108 start_codon:yes stop_codon:yes gene_type:complete
MPTDIQQIFTYITLAFYHPLQPYPEISRPAHTTSL